MVIDVKRDWRPPHFPYRRRPAGLDPGLAQPPKESRSARDAWASLFGESWATRRLKTARGRVCRLSKLTTQSVGTPSLEAVSPSSETRPLLVRVRAATTMD